MDIGDIVGMIAMLFSPDIGGKDATTFDKVVSNIYTMPLPDLSSPDFRAQYAVMWGFGIIVSIVAGFTAALFVLGKSMTSIGSSVSIAGRLMFFVQVVAVGFLAPPVIYLVFYIGDVLTDLSQPVFNHDKDMSWWDVLIEMFSPDTGFDYVIEKYAVWLINHQMDGTQRLIPAMVMLTSAAFAFSVLGKAGQSIWKGWYAVLLTIIFVKPALAWLFALGAWVVSSEPNSGETSISLFALLVAGVLPLIMLVTFYKKADPPLHPMMMSAPASVSITGMNPTLMDNRQSSGMSNALAPLAGAAGWFAAKHDGITDGVNSQQGVAPRTPGSLRVAAAGLTRSKAKGIANAHPVGAVVLTLGSSALRQSGARASTKLGPGAVNAPLSPQTPHTPEPPVASQRRPSLGRMDNGRRPS